MYFLACAGPENFLSLVKFDQSALGDVVGLLSLKNNGSAGNIRAVVSTSCLSNLIGLK